MGTTREKQPSAKIQWHPAFCAAAELELRSNKGDLEFKREYNLSKKPLQMDLLIIEKRKGVQIQNEIGKIFRGHNIIEYKSPDIPADARYEYQLAATKDSSTLLEDQWKSECPKIINATFDQYVFVKVITDNYESKVFRSNDPINIERREFTKDNVAVTVNPQTVVYNGKVRNSEIKVEVFENWSGFSGNKVDSTDYTILGWTDQDGNPVEELKDAGTYIVRLMGAKRNYWENVVDASFTINKCKLKSQMEGGPLDKVYDGTTNSRRYLLRFPAILVCLLSRIFMWTRSNMHIGVQMLENTI